ncbi:glycerophosphodiester phosphodiesterase GDPDL7-like [Wolffia australiana]
MAASIIFIALSLLAGASHATKWPTLSGSGEAPKVVARGGYSGIFPDQTAAAFLFANAMSMSNVVLFCDLQLTKDGVGICRTDLRLDNSTNIADVFPGGAKTYDVNGSPLQGWFSIDFTALQIFSNVTASQNVFSRPNIFDGAYPITSLDDVRGLRPSSLWLNVQYDAFYGEHGQDMAGYVANVAAHMPVDYLSSPEVSFLKKMARKVGRGTKTKLVLRVLGEDETEPTTRQSYASLLKDLSALRPFCSGILVPKGYIWPVDEAHYLGQPSDLVAEAHRLGLEVFAYPFANDLVGSYNYSYDPTAEYLQFVGGSDFAVDGVLTDFPSSASEAIACFAQGQKGSTAGKGLVISHNGASGDFAGSTDLAYKRAVEDGADIIDCSVQMTNDGVAICLGSADLTSFTTASATFMAKSTLVPEIQPSTGIFSFDLTWSEIQRLKPELKSPLPNAGLKRNPAMKNAGKLLTLPEFLDLAQTTSAKGVLVNIENAAFLASKKGLDAVGAATAALGNSSFTRQVMVQSDDSAVLSRFRDSVPSYRRVLLVKETVSDAPAPTVEAIARVAHAVNLPRSSVVSTSGGFLVSSTDVVSEMHAANLSVFVSVLRNEFMAVAFDYFADPVVETASYISQFGADGVVTEFPATAAAYLRSPCYNYTAVDGYAILPVQPGSLLGMAAPGAAPPTEPPAPALTLADVVDPPLPAVSDLDGASPDASPTSPSHPSGQPLEAIPALWLVGTAIVVSAFL